VARTESARSHDRRHRLDGHIRQQSFPALGPGFPFAACRGPGTQRLKLIGIPSLAGRWRSRRQRGHVRCGRHPALSHNHRCNAGRRRRLQPDVRPRCRPIHRDRPGCQEVSRWQDRRLHHPRRGGLGPDRVLDRRAGPHHVAAVGRPWPAHGRDESPGAPSPAPPASPAAARDAGIRAPAISRKKT